jgi:hypothetical protein
MAGPLQDDDLPKWNAKQNAAPNEREAKKGLGFHDCSGNAGFIFFDSGPAFKYALAWSCGQYGRIAAKSERFP